MRHFICQPQKHLSQINKVVIPKACPHNIHCKLVGGTSFSQCAPSTQLTCPFQDGLMKSCSNQSMFFHTTLGIPHKIMYLG
jgi:hypothetical protein